MADFEYFSGTPEVGIVPRAPHAGPLLQHVFEQEHGRGGFAGKVSHTYHLYPPTNWLPDETRADGFAPDWESPLQPLGGVHHALAVRAGPRRRRVSRDGPAGREHHDRDERQRAARPDGLLLRAPLGDHGVLRPPRQGHAGDHVRADRLRAG